MSETPRDSNGEPITVERIYADAVRAGRFDVAAALVEGLQPCPNCGSIAWKNGQCEWCSFPPELRQARS